jgi:hypothetical protein
MLGLFSSEEIDPVQLVVVGSEALLVSAIADILAHYAHRLNAHGSCGH